MMMQWIKLYLLTVPVFFAVDFLWLGFVATKLYQKYLGFILADHFNIPAAFLFYFMYIVGIILFAVAPALSSQSLMKALFLGATFGFIAYATYDLTNLSTLKDWPLVISIIDMIWGTILTGSVATLSYLIARRFIFKS